MKINLGDPYWHFDRSQVKRIEPDAEYVADLAVKFPGTGIWTPYPVAVFFTPTPRKGYSNQYFGVHKNGGRLFCEEKWFICDATSAVEHEWDGIEQNDEIVFSRWKHDFRTFSFGGVNIDGGPEYTRLVGYNLDAVKRVKLKIVEGQFHVV